MQASKIRIEEIYAYEQGGVWVRFQVNEITTTRKPGHNITSIKGIIIDADGLAGVSRTVEPQDLDGPYEAKAELLAQKKAEDERRQAAQDADKAERERKCAVLYRFVRVRPNPKVKDYSRMFRGAYYGTGVEISQAAADKLVKRIEELEAAGVLSLYADAPKNEDDDGEE